MKFNTNTKIDKKIDELAKNSIPKYYEEDDEWTEPFVAGFKAGYYKAMEDKNLPKDYIIEQFKK